MNVLYQHVLTSQGVSNRFCVEKRGKCVREMKNEKERALLSVKKEVTHPYVLSVSSEEGSVQLYLFWQIFARCEMNYFSLYIALLFMNVTMYIVKTTCSEDLCIECMYDKHRNVQQSLITVKHLLFAWTYFCEATILHKLTRLNFRDWSYLVL